MLYIVKDHVLIMFWISYWYEIILINIPKQKYSLFFNLNLDINLKLCIHNAVEINSLMILYKFKFMYSRNLKFQQTLLSLCQQ